MRISDGSSDVCSSDLVSGADGAGSASALDAGDELAIASYGTGALTISDGGAVSVGSKAYIGLYADSLGTLTIGAAADAAAAGAGALDRKGVVAGTRVSVRVDLGVRRVLKKKNK